MLAIVQHKWFSLPNTCQLLNKLHVVLVFLKERIMVVHRFLLLLLLWHSNFHSSFHSSILEDLIIQWNFWFFQVNLPSLSSKDFRCRFLETLLPLPLPRTICKYSTPCTCHVTFSPLFPRTWFYLPSIIVHHHHRLWAVVSITNSEMNTNFNFKLER
jgi:hypothetical protein